MSITLRNVPRPVRAVLLLLAAALLGVLVLVIALGPLGLGPERLRAGSTADKGSSSIAPEPAIRGTTGGSQLTTPSTGDASSGKAEVGTVAATTPMSRAVVSTGQVTLHSRSLARARAEVLRLTAAWGGTVADERTSGNRAGRLTESVLTLRVPSARFSEAMTALAGLGDVEQSSRSSEDVTTQVIDNDARIRAAERSIRSIERLLDRAKQLSDVIAIEADLARRQADLDSLEQQQAYLRDQTSLSTINVFLSLPRTAPAPGHEARGFLAGLGDGWDALRSSTTVLLTGLGAVLPFAVLAGLLGVPLWLVVRRRRPTVPRTADA